MSFAQARLSSFPTQSLRGTAPIIAPVVAPGAPGAGGSSDSVLIRAIPYVAAAAAIYFLLHQTAKQLTPPRQRRRYAH